MGARPVAAGSTAAVNRRAEQSPCWGRSAPEGGIEAHHTGSRMRQRRPGEAAGRKLGLPD